jgi:hypothetical protein
MPAAGIGTLKESSLHLEIKNWYLQDGDLLEKRVGGYVIDILRGELGIEIQTGSFSKLRDKLHALLADRQVRVIYPIPEMKWVSRRDVLGNSSVSRRRSPKKGSIYSLFDELVHLRSLIGHPNFSVEILLIEQEDIWINDNKGSWRRKYWSIFDRHLVAVFHRVEFKRVEDYRSLLPEGIVGQFSSYELSMLAGIQPRLARKMLYCFAIMGIIHLEGVKNRRRYYSLI